MSPEQELPTEGVLTRYEQGVIERINNFNDPRQGWRRLSSELLGTFFLVLVAAGAGMMSHAFPGVISRQAAVVAPGLMVMAVILFMGKVSGAHLPEISRYPCVNKMSNHKSRLGIARPQKVSRAAPSAPLANARSVSRQREKRPQTRAPQRWPSPHVEIPVSIK